MAMRLELLKDRVYNKRSQWLAIIPFLFTFANAVAGFLALICALENYLLLGAYCIIIAVIMDACDGAIARALNSTSDLGFELDSLCDVVSFCVAPALLFYRYLSNSLGVVGLLALMLYLLCGLFRLARFNCSKGHYLFFKGLPTTMAAFFLSTIIMHHDWIAQHSLRICLHPKILLFAIVFIAGCMISSLPFPTTRMMRINSLHAHILRVSLFIVSLIAVAQGFPLLLVISTAYIINGLVTFLHKAMRTQSLES